MQLRPSQKEIIKYAHGKLGIAAVPGSGKTWTLSLLAADLPAGMDLPSPARVEFANSTGVNLRCLYLAANCSGSAANQAALVSVLEAEDGSGMTPAADGACSGGNYAQASWSGTGEAVLVFWTLSTAMLDDYLGHLFKFLLRLKTGGTAYTDLWLKVKLFNQISSVVMAETSWVLAPHDEDLVELPTLRIPPYRTANQNYASFQLAISGKRYTTGSHTLDMDFLHVLPADVIRKYMPVAFIAQNDALVDDYPNGIVYTSKASSAGEIVTHYGVGDPLLLLPGRTQRLYFAWDDGTDFEALIDYAATVRLWVTPRRRAL